MGEDLRPERTCRSFRVISASLSALVADTAGDVSGRHVPRSRVDMASLVVEEKVGFELAQELALGQATQEHRFVDLDVPVHQGADGSLVRGRTAGGNQRGSDSLRRIARLLQPVQRRKQWLTRHLRQWEVGLAR